jgi:hypothetical protein
VERVAPPRLRARDVVRDRPNFRDHGRTVDRPLLDLLVRLQARHGRAYASEAGLRRMICADTGHMPGVTTVQKALRRLGAQGLVVQVWLRAGQIMPDGAVSTHGTRLVFAPQARRARRAAIAWNARQDRRAGYETRMTARRASELVGKIAAPPAAPPRPTVDPFAAERARQLATAEEWAKQHDDATKKPPD